MNTTSIKKSKSEFVLLKIVKSDQRQKLLSDLGKEFYKDNITNRFSSFRKRLFDRTVHPTQMYALKVDLLFQKIVVNYLNNRSFLPSTQKQLANAIEYLHSRPEEVKRMGELAHELAMKNFDIKKNALKVLEIYGRYVRQDETNVVC